MNYLPRIIRVFLVMVTCLIAVNISFADDVKPSGTVSIKSKSIAVGIGINWGNGTLKFEDKEYKFEINGLSVVDLGISSVEATGVVYYMQNLSDFEGSYAAVSAGIDVAVGGGGTVLKNEHEVAIKLKSTKQGVQLTLAGESVKIKLVD